MSARRLDDELSFGSGSDFAPLSVSSLARGHDPQQLRLSFRLHPRTLRFVSPTKEREYREFHWQHRDNLFKAVMGVIGGAIAFSLLFREILDGGESRLFVVRGCSLFVFLVASFLILVLKLPFFVRNAHLVVVIVVITASTAAVLRAILEPGSNDPQMRYEDETESSMIVLGSGAAGYLFFQYGPYIQITLVIEAILVELSHSGGVPAWLYLARLLVMVYQTRIMYHVDRRDRGVFVALRLVEAERAALHREETLSVRILDNILPRMVSAELKQGVSNPAQHHEACAVFFCDIIGFTPFCSRLESSELVRILNTVFLAIDSLCQRHNLDKIQTVGDAFVAVGGLGMDPTAPVRTEAQIAEDALRFAFAVREKLVSLVESRAIPPLALRTAVSFGSLTSGVIGADHKFTWGVFGPALDRAVELEGSGRADAVHVDVAIVSRFPGDLRVKEDPKDPGAVFAFAENESASELSTPRVAPSTRVPSLAPDVAATHKTVRDVVHQRQASFSPNADDNGVFASLGNLEYMFDKRWAVFANPEAEREYRDYMSERQIQTHMIAKGTMLIIWGAYMVVDRFSVFDPNQPEPSSSTMETVLFLRLGGLLYLAAWMLAWYWAVVHRRWFLSRVFNHMIILGLALWQVVVLFVYPLEIEDFVDRAQLQVFVVMVVVNLDSFLPFASSLAIWAMLIGGTAAAYTRKLPSDRVMDAFIITSFLSAVSVIGEYLFVWAQHGFYQTKMRAEKARLQLISERETTEFLLLNILPQHVCERLRDTSPTSGRSFVADHATNATFMFIELVGFSEVSATLAPGAALNMLNCFVVGVDNIIRELHLEKIKTFRNMYFAATALLDDNVELGARRMAAAALDILASAIKLTGGVAKLAVRIGINSGPATSGVLGKLRFAYDSFGDSVNTAARMCAYADPVLVTASTRALLEGSPYVCPAQGVKTIKGKGEMEVFGLELGGDPAPDSEAVQVPGVQG